jgi:hypothetical protein
MAFLLNQCRGRLLIDTFSLAAESEIMTSGRILGRGPKQSHRVGKLLPLWQKQRQFVAVWKYK